MITKEKIVEIAKRDGKFIVSFRYREDYLRTMCNNLVKEGILRQIKSERSADVYAPTLTNKN